VPFFPAVPQQEPINLAQNFMVGRQQAQLVDQRNQQMELLRMQQEAAQRKLQSDTATRGALRDYYLGQQDPGLAALAEADPQVAIELEKNQSVIGDKQIKRMRDALDFALKVGPTVPLELYPSFRADMIRRGVPEASLPTTFSSPEEFEKWKEDSKFNALGLKDQIDVYLKRAELKKPSYHSYQEGDETVSMRWTPLGGEQRIGSGPKWSSSNGIEVDLGDGKVVRVGGNGQTDTGLQKTTANQVEKDLLQQSGTLSELIDVSKAFKPEYQTWEGQMKAGWIGVKEKLQSVFGQLPEDQKSWYQDMSSYVAKAGKLMAESYHEVAGAALTETERKRYYKALIDVEKDSPTQAKQKRANWIEKSRKAIARLNYLRKNGFSVRTALRDESAPSLDSPEVKQELGSMMQQRAMEIETSLAQAGYAKGSQQNQEMTKRQLAEEFGLMY